MTKYLLLSAVFLSLGARAQSNDFEAELRMLEQKEEAAFTRAETLTNTELTEQNQKDQNQKEQNQNELNIISDSVSSAASSVKKREEGQLQRSEITITPPTVKIRRIRSR